MISPFSKGVFGVRLGEMILLFGSMETILRGCVFGWHGREKFGCFQGKKVGVFFVFQKIFLWWCEMGWNFIYLFFFHNMMT
jgi:hypothetical protein